MHNTPLVTVICLCYNHAAFVVASLESALKQSHPNVELIIADDCSTDNSVEVIERWLKNHPEIPFISNLENVGNTKTFNKCLKLAKGAYIIDLAADDVLKVDCIVKQLKGFAESTYENVGIVYGNAQWIDENGIHIQNYFPTDSSGKGLVSQPTGDIYLSLLNGKTKLCSISALTKKTVFDTLNGYDEHLAYEDYDLWIRAARSFHVDYVDDILVQKRMLDTSMFALSTKRNDVKTRRFNYSTYLILQKVFVLNKSKAEFKAMLLKIKLEMQVAIHTRDFGLLLKYIRLDLKVRKKIMLY
ncbi:glycosyltransferase [Flavobacterium antarcticum]|uniref:glycosyltransferase family 2 protein n=1 Tax=Flavobacterium antarcticum TaxID=271155 RepID=UPI0003B5B78D|nr:glycosyltransferase [Flavobacterium antarcticum]